MKKNLLPVLVVLFSQFACPNPLSAQTPSLGTVGDFVLFSGVGAVSNTGISQLTGNIGTNSGAISSFGNVNGVMHIADAATAQAASDLQSAWYTIVNMVPTTAHLPVLGNGETIYAGVDTLAAAGSIVGSLTFDAQGNPNAVFVIKTGGALTTAASATVNLINGATACNVFWVAEGAISMATMTTMSGTLIAHNGAVDMGAGGTLEGRMFSTTGAVSVYGTLAYIPSGCGRPILTGPPAPILNTIACYALFSSAGVVANAGGTHVTGDIGTNQNSVTGYNPLFIVGLVHTLPDLSTAQGASDLQNVYTYLNALPYDIELLYPAQFGNKLVLTPHTYRMNAAAIFTDTLYLNAEGNPDAIFVIQINGALTTSTWSTVTLINGAQAKNVFWKVEGAVTINDNSTFCGTIVCHNGSISLNTGVALAGRSLTTLGLINTTAITANNAFGGFCSVTLPIAYVSFTGACDQQNIVLKWSTATETNNQYFTVERSADGKNWQTAGVVEGAGSSSLPHSYSFTDGITGQPMSWYRIKQTDFDGSNKYGIVITVGDCGADESGIVTVNPNPSTGKFTLSFTGDKSQVMSTDIFSSVGVRVYEHKGFQPNLDLSDKAQGMYYVRVHLRSKTISREILVKRS
ncbi:MAG TPA: ice-binding family protein [Puia sp.]|nr:ice-binding family protein [Puia sp.]